MKKTSLFTVTPLQNNTSRVYMEQETLRKILSMFPNVSKSEKDKIVKSDMLCIFRLVEESNDPCREALKLCKKFVEKEELLNELTKFEATCRANDEASQSSQCAVD